MIFVSAFYPPTVGIRFDLHGRTIWIADAHRDDGKRFIARAEEKLTTC